MGCTSSEAVNVDEPKTHPIRTQAERDADRITTFIYKRTETISNKYTLLDQIGQPGAFGFARKAKNNATGDIVAVKVINKAPFARAPNRRVVFDSLRGEIEIMRTLTHDNTIKLYDVFEEPAYLYLVMELCEGGELFDRIKARKHYSEADAAVVIKQMIEAIAYLHDRNIAHCDLKPDNFLFLDITENSRLKLIDYGMSKALGSREYIKHKLGTVFYMAPEVIRHKFNKESDMWSIGVVMFVMLFGFPPFFSDGNQQNKIFKLILKGFDPSVKSGYGPWFPQSLPVSEDARDLIAKLITNDVDRLTAKEALSHRWLKEPSDTALSTLVLDGLRTFDSTSHLQVSLLHLFTDKLPNSEVVELKETFAQLDKNGDGTVSLKELREALATHPHPDAIEEIFAAADIDGDGQLCYEELLLASVHRRITAKQERVFEAFQSLDANGDGSLTPDELRMALVNAGQDPKDAEELVKIADTNNDGVIDSDEFLRLWYDKECNALPKVSEEEKE